MIKRLLFCLLTLCPACILIAGPPRENDSHRAYKKRFAVKHISKRDGTSCQTDTQYLYNTTTDAICCYSCEPGKHDCRNPNPHCVGCRESSYAGIFNSTRSKEKASRKTERKRNNGKGYVATYVGCKKADPKTNCKRCTEGIEYMDKLNHKTKCLRCNDCDRQHGLEVETNCTVTQNIKCKCIPGFFCDSQPCQHCNPCDKCENGIILEKCTETKDTICQRKEKVLWWHWVIPLLSVIVVAVLACFIWIISVRNNYEPKTSTLDESFLNLRSRRKARERKRDDEMGPPSYPDFDLTHCISDIAEEMKLEEVIKLVRKLGMSPIRMEEVTLNNNNNISEQKIKLLECWHQENGRNGAYGTLITTLKELHFYATAEKIMQKIGHGRVNRD